MKTGYKIVLAILLIFKMASGVLAQEEFTLGAEYRLNPLYSHGFRIPIIEGRTAEGYISQRTRLILNYNKANDLKTELVIQDLRAWGTYRNNGQAGNFSLFRAWAEKSLTDHLSVRMGRQGFIYGDQFILGGLNWGGNMAHDAALVKFENNGFEAHLALAYNTTGFVLQQELYTYQNHKNMQFLWLTKKTDKLSASFVFLNQGMQKPNDAHDIRYNHTTGVNLSYNVSKQLQLKGIYYHQFGEDTVRTGRTVNAYLYSLSAKYKASDKLSLTLGADVVSGQSSVNAANTDYNERNNFDILYGLRHGKYGYLDYFYTKLWPVTGLEDYYLKAKIKTSERTSMDVHWHSFFSNAQVTNSSAVNMNDYYGSELDLRWHYNQSENTKITLGFSHMWVTDTYLSYYDETTEEGSSTVYAVITIKPTFINKTL